MLYVSTAGADANDGLSPDRPKLTIQAGIDASPTGGRVSVEPGTYLGLINMRPGIELLGSPGTIVTQANGANLGRLVDFDLYAAHGASLTGITFDGNRANNADNANFPGINIGTANNVRIERCKIWNMTGSGIAILTGTRPVIRSCDFQNIPTASIASSAFSPVETCGDYSDNTFSGFLGQTVILISKSNHNRVRGNRIEGTQAVGTCSVSGNTVTWVSGANFANIKPGGFIIGYPNGAFSEGYITAVASPTLLTINQNLGAATFAFVAGTGDMISVGNSIGTTISGNKIRGGASGAVVLNNFNGGQYQYQTVIENNDIYYIGGTGISLQSRATTPMTYLSDTSIINNRIVSCGQGGDAVGATGRNAISLIDFSPVILGSVWINGNRFQNSFGPPMLTAIYNPSTPASQVTIGANASYGV